MTTFALDFDDTFTADPSQWLEFIEGAKVRGHRVFIVTARSNTQLNLKEIRYAVGSSIPVVMTGGSQKKWFCVENDIVIDVWIDDCPEAVVGDQVQLNEAREEVSRMQLLVNEVREGRDLSEQKAKEDCQKEMALLRSEIANLKAKSVAEGLADHFMRNKQFVGQK